MTIAPASQDQAVPIAGASSAVQFPITAQVRSVKDTTVSGSPLVLDS